MEEYLKAGKIDQAIEKLESEIKDNPQDQIIEAFKKALLTQEDMLSRNDGVILENGVQYDLKSDIGILSYMNRDLKTNEKTFEPTDAEVKAILEGKIENIIEMDYS